MAHKKLKKGIFITFEGIEGCGKSTHSALLYNHLKKLYQDCIHTREPGGTKLGEALRRTLLHSKDIEISDLAELFLFEAARSQIVKELICPALEEKKLLMEMNRKEAKLSRGEPKEINRNETPYSAFEQWVYESTDSPNYLYFTDDKLISWHD